MVKKGIAVGIKKKRGFPTTPRKKVQKPQKKSKRNEFIQDLIYEVAGYAPYEGRLMELIGLHATTHSAEKRPLKFAKARLGSIKRAKLKLKFIAELRMKVQRRQQEILRMEQEAKEKK